MLLSNFAVPRANNAPTETTIQKTLDNREVQDSPINEPTTTEDAE